MTNANEVSNLIDAALFFAERGVRVFPLLPNDKRPSREQSSWQEIASTNDNLILNWFAISKAGSNLAVVCDDLFVVDVDTLEHGKGDKDGPRTLAALTRTFGELPDTLEVQTASGGRHIYFSKPEGYTTTKRADKFGPGLDLQTGNAYLVGPHSVINGREYRITNFAEIAPAPQWLLDLANQRQPHPVDRARTVASSSNPVSNAYVRAAVNGELGRLTDCERSGWNGPPWDMTTYEVACNLIEIANNPQAGYDLNRAYSDFMAAAPTDAKFGPRQHEAKWLSALKKVGTSARVFPAPKTPQAQPNRAPAIPSGVAPEAPAPASPPGPPAPPKPRKQYEHPDEYMGKGGLLTEKLARAVSDDFGLGPDLELWLYSGGIFKHEPMELMRRVTSALRDRYRPASYKAVEDFVKALPGIPQLQIEVPDQRFIHLANGVYDWHRGRLLEHSPDYGAITQLAVSYDPNAKCPQFERYLSEVVPADVIEVAWELIAYLMLFGNPMQVAVILHGPGGNGKSTFLRVIQHMLGKSNVSALSLRQMTEDRFAVAGLLGKTANLAGDIDAKYLSDSSRFKQITGGDLITVERKFGQPFDFEPYAVPVFSANEFWKTADTTHGYFRRWLALPFPYPVDGSRPLNEADLLAESSGIFNEAMKRLAPLMAREKFTHSESVNELKRLMEDASDILADWMQEDDSIVANNPQSDQIKCNRADAYRAFKAWCMHSGHKGMSSTNFYKRLAQLNYGQTKINGTRYIVGIEIARNFQPTIGELN